MNDIRLCFVGDSFVNGTGDPQCLGWAGRLCGRMADSQKDAITERPFPITYYNLGIRRNTSRDIALRWETEVKRRFIPQADCRVVFSFGTNDTTLEVGTLRVPTEESLHNAQTILSQAQQQFPTLMIGPPPIQDPEQNQRTSALSQQFAQICHQLAVPYLDIFPTLAASETWMQEVSQGDGAHPQAAGYALLADVIQQWSAWQNWFV